MVNYYVLGVTIFWIIIGAVLPIFAKGSNQGVIRCCLILTSICAWLFWFVCYLAQMNPIEGPQLARPVHLIVSCVWGNKVVDNCLDL